MGDGNENLIPGSYFTRKWIKMPALFMSEKEKRKRSFWLPLFGHKTHWFISVWQQVRRQGPLLTVIYPLK